MNQTVIVGRLVDNPKLEKTDNGKKVMNMTVAVPRTYKNEKGEYDTDFVDCVLWSSIAENTAEYCKKGDVVGVKGRVQTDLYDKDGQTHKSSKLVAEKVTFLQSSRSSDREEESTNKKNKDKGKEK